jgi:hypothetical protein
MLYLKNEIKVKNTRTKRWREKVERESEPSDWAQEDVAVPW